MTAAVAIQFPRLDFGQRTLRNVPPSTIGGNWLGGATPLPKRARVKASLVTERGVEYVIPHAPPLSSGGLAVDLGNAPRVGLKPFSWIGGEQLRTYTFTLTIAGRDRVADVIDPTVSIEDQLETLRQLGRSGERVTIKGYGPSSVGWYRISNLQVDDKRRNEDNDITVAELQIQLTEVTDATVFVGPLSGGALVVARQAVHPGATTTPSASFTTGGIPTSFDRSAAEQAKTIITVGSIPAAFDRSAAEAAKPGRERTYTCTDGDSWVSISYAFYGSPKYYQRLMDYNRIVGLLYNLGGLVIKIPDVSALGG